MIRWIAITVFGLILTAQVQESPTPEKPEADEKKPTSQPTTQPSARRTPEQARILEGLLTARDRPAPIKPTPQPPSAHTPAAPAQPEGLRVEGTFIVERPGRLTRQSGRSVFTFNPSDGPKKPVSMLILENQLLEIMEREAAAGFSEFIISAEVTTYRSQNYLLIRKVLRRTSHGNIGP